MELNHTSLALLRVLYNKFGKGFVSVEEMGSAIKFLNIGDKYFYKILSILAKNKYLSVSKALKDKRFKLYRVNDLGLSCMLSAKVENKKIKRATTKFGNCYGCNKIDDLTLYRGQYLCGKCLVGDEDEDLLDLNLEDYVYANTGLQW